MAAAACLTCSRNEVPPTPGPSIQRGVMPSACATCTGPGALTVAMPSMSLKDKPASATAFTAASRCKPSVEYSGSLPSRSVSEAPAMIAPVLTPPPRHVEHECLRCLRHADDVRHHARTFGELHNSDGVGRVGLEPRRRPVIDDVRVQGRVPAGGEPVHADRAA